MLYRYGDLKKRIAEYHLEISAQYEERDSFLHGQLTPPPMDNVKVQGGILSDPVYRSVRVMVDVYDERIIRLQEQLRELYYEHDEIKRAIDGAGLTDQERDYLQMRYVDRMSTVDVADRQGYSESHARNIKRNLLRKIGGKDVS